MTTRERRLAKAERLREWSEGREAKAAAAREASRDATAGIPFGQPILVGHHSERRHRAAVERGQNKATQAVEHGRTATRMAERADNIEAAVEAAIYDDDPDAVERLREKVAALEAKRERIKAENAAFRKAHRDELKALNGYERDCAMPHAGYVLRNLGGVLSTTRKRLAQLEANGGKPADRLITARYDGTCVDCGAELKRGDQIRYNRVDGARCAKCDTGQLADGGGEEPPADRPAETFDGGGGQQRTFTSVGSRYTTDDRRAQVLAAIGGLEWTRIADVDGESLSLPFSPGEAIKAAIRELRLPKVSAIAWNGALEFPGKTAESDGEYPGLYGIEANYANGRVRVYLVDSGCELLPAVIDHWPA